MSKDEIPLEPHVERMVNESLELSERIMRAEGFRMTDTYANLPFTDRAMLDAQIGAMNAYSVFLGYRVDKATGRYS
jgi:hypothetical protein